ncbi:cytochrome P450, family 76, subfamily C, polypeptide 4 [Hibiscus trionum]|uniref:Cytochrome P450, family 76, subfamily C, polypeptide 4 n=1 Tax=Hibiscus trionum TaxID=183268 RepID=A0A9W7J3S2_HIBTR|nr:cytochrome P450, family 76, subfamily C, polypeptide 4 [Hibiscus trionum]
MDFLTTSLLYLLLTMFLFPAFNSFRNGRKLSGGKLPPGPRRLPILGNLLDLGDKPHRSLAKLAQIHGPVMSLQLGSLFTVVVSSETTAKEVLQKQDLVFCNRTVVDAVRASQFNEFGLSFIPVSPIWRSLRKVCVIHLFSTLKLDANQYLRREKIEELIGNVRKSSLKCEAINVGQAAFDATINLLSNTIFSMDLVDPNSSHAQEFRKTVWDIAHDAGIPNLADYFPLLTKIDPQGIRRRMTVYFDKLLTLFGNLFDERSESRKSMDSSGSSNDVLDTLIDIIEDGIEELDRTQIIYLLLILFVAGTDTTSNTAEWAMAELLRSPQVLLKAKKEIEQAIGKGNLIEEDDVNHLPYLQAIIKETFRMQPAVPLLVPRRAGSDADLCGFKVPEGSQVLVNAWAIGRDPSIWENPDSFMPERFLGSKIDVKGTDFELIPFGAGRRICPGLPLGNRMLHLIVGSLLNCFDWKLEDGISPDDITMEENCGITVQKAIPLRAIPIVV